MGDRVNLSFSNLFDNDWLKNLVTSEPTLFEIMIKVAAESGLKYRDGKFLFPKTKEDENKV